MVNYKPWKSLPKVGDIIVEEYVDTTKGISEEDRDDLTAYLCTFEELNFTFLDILSMVHDTISFIIHHSDSDRKGTTPVYIVNFNIQMSLCNKQHILSKFLINYMNNFVYCQPCNFCPERSQIVIWQWQLFSLTSTNVFF